MTMKRKREIVVVHFTQKNYRLDAGKFYFKRKDIISDAQKSKPKSLQVV